MKKLTADVARKIYDKSQQVVYGDFQTIINEIVNSSKARGRNTFIDLAPHNLAPIAKELEERGFKVWIREDRGYLEVEW